jgi:hypothetical protein
VHPRLCRLTVGPVCGATLPLPRPTWPPLLCGKGWQRRGQSSGLQPGSQAGTGNRPPPTAQVILSNVSPGIRHLGPAPSGAPALSGSNYGFKHPAIPRSRHRPRRLQADPRRLADLLKVKLAVWADPVPALVWEERAQRIPADRARNVCGILGNPFYSLRENAENLKGSPVSQSYQNGFHK